MARVSALWELQVTTQPPQIMGYSIHGLGARKVPALKKLFIFSPAPVNIFKLLLHRETSYSEKC